MPSVIGTDITKNYLKTRPSTRFATRQLVFLGIYCSGIQNNFYNQDSLFTKVVRGVQLVAEVFAVGTPHSDYLTVVVAADTNASQAEINEMARSLENQLNSGGISVNINNRGLWGNNLANIGSGQEFSDQDPNNYSDAQSYNDGDGNPHKATGLRPAYENEDVTAPRAEDC